VCDLCGKFFNRRADVKRHVHSIHMRTSVRDYLIKNTMLKSFCLVRKHFCPYEDCDDEKFTFRGTTNNDSLLRHIRDKQYVYDVILCNHRAYLDFPVALEKSPSNARSAPVTSPHMTPRLRAAISSQATSASSAPRTMSL
jgi:hypothetical protein